MRIGNFTGINYKRLDNKKKENAKSFYINDKLHSNSYKNPNQTKNEYLATLKQKQYSKRPKTSQLSSNLKNLKI